MVFAGGDGSAGDPYQISTPQQLQDMQNDLTANYVLINDIDCSGFNFSSVGSIKSTEFTGVLDGQGHVVENLEITEEFSFDVGLIGYLDEGGEIRDIGVVNANISGEHGVGALAGVNRGTISNSFSTGSVEGLERVGGLIGANNDGTVSNTYSRCSVEGVFAIDEPDGYYVGGLVGENFSTISNSFSTGSVEGEENVGGLVGGGSGTVSDSYWDTDSSGQSSSAGGTGLTTSEIQGAFPYCKDTMPGLDFQNDWVTEENDYPELRLFSQTTENLTCIFPDFSISDTSPKTGETVTFDASSTSVEKNASVSSYEWDLNEDGTYEATGVTADKTYSTTGTKTATLLVTASNSDTFSISKELNVLRADFSVTITGGDSFVFKGDVLNIEYSVENVGEASGTQDIELTTTVQGGSTVVDSDTVSLNSGESKTGTLSYDLTGEPVEPEETATISTDDSSVSGTFFVAQYRFLESIAELEDGQEYEFRAAAEDDFGIDTGEIKTVETVERTLGSVTTETIDTEDTDQTELTVEGSVDTVGDYAEVGFDVFFQYRVQGDSQWTDTSRSTRNSTGQVTETITNLPEETTYEYRFVADFGGDLVTGTTNTATTLAPVFEFAITSINDYLKEGRTLSIDYEAENTGTVSSTQDIQLAFDTEGNVVDTNSSVTIDSGATSSGTLTFDTTGQSESSYNIYLSAVQNKIQETIDILDTTLVDFEGPSDQALIADRTPEISTRVDVEGTGTVEVIVDGTVVDTIDTPQSNNVFSATLDPQNRNNQSRNWNIVYSGDGPSRDRTQTFTIGFERKEVEAEQL